MNENKENSLSLGLAMIPLLFLMALLAISISVFGDESSSGPIQISLLFAGGVTAIIGLLRGISWQQLQNAAVDSIASALGPVMVLLVIGALIGSWLVSGSIQAIIYYSLQFLSAEYFYLASCLICAFVALCIGGSWATVGTIGVALIATASTLGVSLSITAGAIVSGSYFGDKMSPLSDTTNLAPAIVGAELFEHIRHMTWTTGPSMVATLCIYLVLGWTQTNDQAPPVMETLNLLKRNFAIHWYSLVPLLIVLVLAVKKVPAIPAVAISALVGALFALLFQQDLLVKFANEPTWSLPKALFKAIWSAMYSGFVSNTGNAELDSLLSRGGMQSMLNTIWMIISALFFGGLIERTGILHRLLVAMMLGVKTVGGLITRAAIACVGTNIIAPDQYMSVVLPGRMFKSEFAAMNLAPKNLSRVMEDTGTLTSPLVPWNTCGAFVAGVLGVTTLSYAPFCFLCIINPVLSVIYGIFDVSIERLPDNST